MNTASVAAADAAQNEGDAKCSEVTAMPAQEAIVPAAQVSPAVSPAVNPSTDENYKIESDGSQSGSQSGTRNAMNACYKCKHRRGVAGSAHSSCHHPSASPIYLTVFMMGKSAISTPALQVKANTHGVRSGWFIWPVNFDPTWLEECTLFEEKK